MKLTIRKFQELYAISLMEIDELDKSVLLVQVWTNKSDDEINKMPIKKFNKLCAEVNSSFEVITKKMDMDKPKQYIKVNGNWYCLNYDIIKKPMTAGRYVETATFSTDIIGNLHKIMATMANPMEWTWKGLKLKEYDALDHERISDDMLDLDFSVAYHSAVFFYALFSKSIKASANYFQSLVGNPKEIQMKKAMEDLSSRMDGYITANWYKNLRILH
jgi:hypothetical protein